MKVFQSRGRRLPISTCGYGLFPPIFSKINFSSSFRPGLDGKWIAGACGDGTIQMWGHSGPYNRPHFVIHDAHVPGSDTSSICFTQDDRFMLSRGGDDTLKVFFLLLGWERENFNWIH